MLVSHSHQHIFSQIKGKISVVFMHLLLCAAHSVQEQHSFRNLLIGDSFWQLIPVSVYPTIHHCRAKLLYVPAAKGSPNTSTARQMRVKFGIGMLKLRSVRKEEQSGVMVACWLLKPCSLNKEPTYSCSQH